MVSEKKYQFKEFVRLVYGRNSIGNSGATSWVEYLS